MVTILVVKVQTIQQQLSRTPANPQNVFGGRSITFALAYLLKY